MNGDAGGSRIERKKERTARKITAVAMELFQAQGFDATTMEQIAEEADVAKGTLYNYFPVKEAILNDFIQRSFKDLMSGRVRKLRELPDTRSRIGFIFHSLIEGVQMQPGLFEKYLVYRMQSMVSFHQDEKVKSGFFLLGNEIIRLGQESGEIRADLPLYILEDLFEFAFIEAVKPLYIEPETFEPRLSIDRCVDLFLEGAGPFFPRNRPA